MARINFVEEGDPVVVVGRWRIVRKERMVKAVLALNVFDSA